MVDATELSFQNVREYWNEYLLDDGTIIKLKPVATEVFRVDDQYDPQGNPVYVLQSTNILVVNVPDEMKRPKSE
jgi:hypothetical protein